MVPRQAATVERCSEASGASYNPDAREVAMAAMRRRSVTCSKLHRMATRLGKDTATAELCHLDYEADADAGPPPQPSAPALNGSAFPEAGRLLDETRRILGRAPAMEGAPVTTAPTLSPVMPRPHNATRLRAAEQHAGPEPCTRCGRNPGGEANCCGKGGAWEGACAHSYGALVMVSAHTWDEGWRACNAPAPAAAPAATAAQRGGEPKEALSPALGRAGASCVLSTLLSVSLVAPVRTARSSAACRHILHFAAMIVFRFHARVFK